jgi:hypothetical protein
MRVIVCALLISCVAAGITGCASPAEGGDYQAPSSGEYKKAEEVPERSGRQRAEAGSASGSAGRSEGG